MAGIYTTGGNARETAYRIIRSRIINLDLKPNAVLSEKQLVEEMGMSRTPVHEAIIMLQMEHLVVIRPQSRTLVAPIDARMVSIEQFCRHVLEKEIVQRVCGRLQEKHWQIYKENLQLYRDSDALQGHEQDKRMLELDNTFHRIAFTVCGKEDCFDWMVNSFQHIERVRLLSLQLNIATHVLEDHEQLVRAMFEGDVPRSWNILEEHLKRYTTDMLLIRKQYPYYFEA